MIPIAIQSASIAKSAKVGDFVAYISCCTGNTKLRIGLINGIKSKSRYWDRTQSDIQMCTTLPAVGYDWSSDPLKHQPKLVGSHILNPMIVAVLDPSELIEFEKFKAIMTTASNRFDEKHLPELHKKMSARYHQLNP